MTLVVIELCVLIMVAGPVVRLIAHPSVRRAFPRTTLTLTVALVVYVTGVIVLAFHFPRVLLPLALAAAAAATVALWRGRSKAGFSKHLPPGSLSALPFGYLIQPSYFQEQADRYGPIFKMNQIGIGAGPNPWLGLLQPVVCVLGLSRGLAVLRDNDDRLMPPAAPFSRFIPKGYLRYMDPADHARYRRVFQSAFLAEVIDESQPFMRRHVTQALSALGEQAHKNAVAPEQPLKEMGFGVFMRCFYGVSPTDRRFDQLRTLYDRIDINNDNEPEVYGSLAELAEIIRAEAREVAARSGRSLPAARSFLGEIARIDLAVLDDVNTIRNLIYIALASWIDLSGLTVWLFKRYCDEPKWQSELRAQLRRTGPRRDDDLSARFVLECLRLHQSEYIYRRLLDEMRIDDFVIPRGWLVRICIRESHRDPRVFEHPNRFDPDRFLHRSYSRTEFSPFGASRISCLGEHFTKIYSRICVETLAERFDCTTVCDGPVEFRRWHWKPSSRFRVRIVERHGLLVDPTTSVSTHS